MVPDEQPALLIVPDALDQIAESVISAAFYIIYHWEFGTPDGAETTIPVTGPGTSPDTSHNYPASGGGDTDLLSPKFY